MHLADTREQAEAEVAFGLSAWVDYFNRVVALPLAPEADNVNEIVAAVTDRSSFAVIGTPDDAIDQIDRLVEQSEGFGTFLLMAHEWADVEATRHSYELFARHVIPHFQRSADSLVASRDWAAHNRAEFSAATGAAIAAATRRQEEENAGGQG
jgi:alkanesulfonate monooxygenase SsuD/methylene tetrahydromethanopterin reductase-like flavin-dependent oxidoreductase (luciferase family)